MLFGCSNLLKKGIQGLVATKRKNTQEASFGKNPLNCKVKKKSAHTCGIPCFVVGLQGTGWKSKPENSVVAPASTKPDSFATCTAMQLIRLRRRRRRRKLYCCRALSRGRSNSNGAFHR